MRSGQSHSVTVTFLIACLLSLSASFAATGSNPTSTFVSTRDQVELAVDQYFVEKPRAVVILLHMFGRTKEDYRPLIGPLTKNHFAVVNVDLRGHGDSDKRLSGFPVNYKAFKNKDWSKLPQDVSDVIEALPQQWEKLPVIVVGASIGANAALEAALINSRITSVVMLSPGLDYRGLCPEDWMKKFRGRAYLVAASDDDYSAQSVNKLKTMSSDATRTQYIFQTGGHGTQLLSSQPQLSSMIVEWLGGRTK